MVQHGGFSVNPFKRTGGKKQPKQIADQVIEKSLTSNYELNYIDVKTKILERLKNEFDINDSKANKQYEKIKIYVQNRLESISKERSTIDEFMNKVLSQMKEILQDELTELEKTEINSEAIKEIKAVSADEDKMRVMILKIVEEYLQNNPIITEEKIYNNSSKINTNSISTNLQSNFTYLNRFVINDISNIIKKLLIEYKISVRTPRLYQLIGQYQRIMDARNQGREKKVTFLSREIRNNNTNKPVKFNINKNAKKATEPPKTLRLRTVNNDLGNSTWHQQQGAIKDHISKVLWSDGNEEAAEQYKHRIMELWKMKEQRHGYGPTMNSNNPAHIITNPNDLNKHLIREKPQQPLKSILKKTGGKKKSAKKTKKTTTKKTKKRITKKTKKKSAKKTKKRVMKKGKKRSTRKH